jgi:hypothetical protein
VRVTTVPWPQASTRVLVLVLGVVVLAACGGSGGAPAVWEPAPEADLSPQSTSIDVLVREMECASGRSADERIMDPEVGLGDEEVVITFRVTLRGGDQDCQGNPATPYTVELGEPLGERSLLDGAHDPPAAPDNDRFPSDR